MEAMPLYWNALEETACYQYGYCYGIEQWLCVVAGNHANNNSYQLPLKYYHK